MAQDGNQRIGVLGGTFNPPHIGHLIMAECALYEFKLDKVLFMPNGTPPHKRDTEISAEARLEMTRLAIAKNSDFELCDIETTSDEVSYTYNTLAKLRRIYENCELYFIVGADSAAELGTWRCPEKIFQSCELIVADRISRKHPKIDAEIEVVVKKYNAEIHRLKMPIIEFSSTDIRKRVRHGLPYKYMLPESVCAYIESNGLYR